MLQVTCAIITNGEKVLAVQRGAETDHPFFWEFPGGKVRNGETEEACICREIEEELSIKISIFNRLVPVVHNYGTKQIHLIPFVCSIEQGSILLTEHIDMQWVLPSNLLRINWSEADRKLIIQNNLTKPGWEIATQ